MLYLTKNRQTQARIASGNILKTSFCYSAVVGLAVLTAGVLISSNSQARTTQECLQFDTTPAVIFTVSNAKTKLNKKKNSRQIEKFAKSINAFKPTVKGRLLGLTFTDVAPQLGVEVEGRQMQNGDLCVRLTQVTFQFGIRRAEIFVDRQYKAGTCNFKAILAHEKEHMKINLAVQKRYEKKLRKKLQIQAGKIRPHLAGSVKSAAQKISAKLTKDLKPLMAQFQKTKRKENLKIDTPKSYQKVRSRCANW
ncbi:MAG: hypothetical protein ABJN40_07665 [Sneathiella sp.]